MIDHIVRAKPTEIIYAQLSQGADLYQSLLELVRKENIKTGLVIDITGGLSKVRLSLPVKETSVEATPGIIELSGTAEASGHGIIGQTLETYDSPSSGITNNKGEPYVHVHLSIQQADRTLCGHLIDGCMIRSLHKKSHFTIAVMRTEGALINFRVSKETTTAYPKGIPYHELIQER